MTKPKMTVREVLENVYYDVEYSLDLDDSLDIALSELRGMVGSLKATNNCDYSPQEYLMIANYNQAIDDVLKLLEG